MPDLSGCPISKSLTQTCDKKMKHILKYRMVFILLKGTFENQEMHDDLSEPKSKVNIMSEQI